MKKFLFLDRDGVINYLTDGTRAPRNLQELRIYEDVVEQIPTLFELGYEIIVVTNQPDISRGLNSIENVEAINQYIKNRIPSISKFLVCYHQDKDFCNCRKPKPGLLLKALAEKEFHISSSYIVGDRTSDIAAGAAIGIQTVLLKRDSIFEPNSDLEISPDYIFRTFTEVSKLIIQKSQSI